MSTDRDIIFLIEPGFDDPRQPGKLWFCPFCNQIEGALASFPALKDAVELHRVAFARPRQAVISALDEGHQSLPVLIFADPATAPADAKEVNGRYFLNDTKRILEVLAERHGTPWPH
jgi:hypothetical protein